MYSIERKSEIERILLEAGSVNVSELADELATSRETIRRDLKEMEDLGVLKRTHGGALPLQPPASTNQFLSEAPVSIRTIRNVSEKLAICKTAAAAISDGDTVFIDNSTTCTNLYQYIPSNIQVTFLTNSIPFLLECSKVSNPKHTFICLGGIFKLSNLSIYGNTTIDNASQYFPNKAFISCSGISKEHHISDCGIQEIDVKRTLINSSQKVYLLADYTKFQQIGQIYLCNYTEIDCLITDNRSDTSKLCFLEQAGVEIIIAK